jgi:hypothetical protein
MCSSLKYAGLLLLSFIFLNFKVNGQERNTSAADTHFSLSNGFTFKGNVLRFSTDSIFIRSENGDTLHFGQNQITVIHPDESKKEKSAITPFLLNTERRLLGRFQFISGFGGQTGSFLSALGIDGGLMYRFNNPGDAGLSHFLTLNTGLALFDGFQETQILPLTTGYQLNLRGTKLSPYIFGAGGWGLNVTRSETSGFESEESFRGGPRWETGCGLVFKSGEMAFDITLSYVSQRAESSFTSAWWNSEVEQHFRRIFLKMGVNF